MVKKAIILAAGQGRRLLPLTRNRPKCLLKVGGKTILEHQMERLARSGIDDVTVVTGYQAEKIHLLLSGRVTYIHNDDCLVTSSLYSFWLARESAKDGFIVLNSDVLFHEEILYNLLVSPHPDVLAMEYNQRLGEEEMKIQVNNGKVKNMSKSLTKFSGENVGIVKFSKKGAEKLLQTVEANVKAGIVNVPIPYAFDQLAKHSSLFGVSTGKLPWIEIDFVEDLEKARQVIHPAIVAMEGTKRAA